MLQRPDNKAMKPAVIMIEKEEQQKQLRQPPRRRRSVLVALGRCLFLPKLLAPTDVLNLLLCHTIVLGPPY